MQTGLVQAVWRALKAVKKIHAAVPEEDRKKMQACIPPPPPHSVQWSMRCGCAGADDTAAMDGMSDGYSGYSIGSFF